MNQRDIFVMTFYCLDDYWDDHQTDELGCICSDLDPFIWADVSSGDPACWSEFCAMFEDKEYTTEEGFEIAKKYVATLGSEEANKAIGKVTLEDWTEGYEEYLNPSEDEE